ncbi:IS200/IS605 family transposase [Thermostichus vulcanus]|uniref:IS200/IS605 family transposase n=1 Tax=Thermostichus vulcanus str. 'Rupite' TaxID=2813851 RepID=A0ABT0CDD6_THEVL|nr:IS200/IS605 family transposase [Thermostichus vulcanus]MCJ2543778.1 IS200/IS605 family transposase [Thermostichus vulcanus str. 'Rupite']
MGQDYRRTRTSVSLINYHFVWCSKRRKKVLTGSIKERLTTLIHDKARELDCEVVSLAVEPDHVHLFLNAPPQIAPYQLMHRIKGATSHQLRKEFPSLLRLPSLWTRSYFCGSAGNVSSEIIQRYIEAHDGG